MSTSAGATTSSSPRCRGWYLPPRAARARTTTPPTAHSTRRTRHEPIGHELSRSRATHAAGGFGEPHHQTAGERPAHAGERRRGHRPCLLYTSDAADDLTRVD